MKKINYLVMKKLDYMVFNPVVMMIDKNYFGYDFTRQNFIRNPALDGSIKEMLSLYKIVDKQEALDVIAYLEAKELLLKGAEDDLRQ